MSKKVYIPLIALGILLSVILSYEITSLILLSDKKHVEETTVPQAYEDEIEENVETEAVIKADTFNLTRITPSTKIVYQYYYKVDDKLVTDECEPPYYLLDMTRQQLESYYTDWQLIAFSSDKVILRKSIAGRNIAGYYMIKSYEGQITVFYDYTEAFSAAFEEAVATGKYKKEEVSQFFNEFMAVNKQHYLREILDTPLSSLSVEDQKKIQEGILVYGDDELIRILENYSS